MFNFLEKTYEGTTDPPLSSPRSSVVQVICPIDGILRTVTVYIQSSIGTSIWNIRAAGVALFAGGARPTIINPAKSFTKTGMTTVVAAGDALQLDLEDAGVSISQPVIVVFTVDDGIYGGLSTTSQSITTGSKTFTTSKGLFYSVGTRVRVARTAAPTTTYMEGVVTAYLGDQLTLTIDLAVGSGTYTDWTLSLTGERGSTGATGSGGFGVPTGGTTGQVLTKIDGTNYNTDWETPAGGGASGTFNPDMPYASPSTEDDEFNAGSLDGKWATLGTAPTTTFDIPNHITLTPPAAAGPMNALVQVPASGDSTWRMKISFKKQGSESYVGIVVHDGSTFAMHYCIRMDNFKLFHNIWTSTTSPFSNQDLSLTYPITFGANIWLEVVYKNTPKTYDFNVSGNGIDFGNVVSAEGTVGGGAMNKVGVMIYGPTSVNAHVDWFRKLQGVYTGKNE